MIISKKDSIFTDASLRTPPHTVLLLVLGIIHPLLFAIILLLLRRRSNWSMVLLLILPHDVLVNLGLLFLLVFLRSVLHLSRLSYAQLLQVLRLPFLALLFLPLDDIAVQSFSILSYRKFLIVVH